MQSRKALLYVPGSDLHKIEKAASSGADCVCLDLEDGVAENMKSEARGIVANALTTFPFGRSERMVRVNSFASGRTADDLVAILPAHPDAILLPKVSEAAQVEAIDAAIRKEETSRGWPIAGIALVVIVESARGIVSLASICDTVDTCPRLQGVVFGAEDFAADMGATRTLEATELLYARSALVTHCVAYGLQAIDLVSVNFKDMELFDREAVRGAQMGFSGKQVIHPAQVEPAQRIFTPSAAEIEWAQLILKQSADYAERGKGAFAVGAEMVDRPVIKRAELVLARAGMHPEN
jgi:citrate lyase subunit beta-like protein